MFRGAFDGEWILPCLGLGWISHSVTHKDLDTTLKVRLKTAIDLGPDHNVLYRYVSFDLPGP